jgi:phosphorylcholine metabolism protein LicD
MSKKLLFKIVSLSLLLIPIYSAESEEEEAERVPISFVRDVMQPAGMPLVSFYHHMRENVFFNTKTPHATPLEAIGNFFLTPSHYLFAGKTISIDGDTLQVSQTFHYDRLHWLKTLLSLISLPVAEPIGISLKGLSYLSTTTRDVHKSIVAGLKSSVVTSHLQDYKSKGIESFHSNKFIPCQGHKRPSTLTKKQKVEIQALKEIITLFEENGILYWIDFGTCLGAYRYGGIIPWDWDIDIAILQDDHENVKRILATLDKEKYKIQDWSSYTRPQSLLKLYVKETKNFLDIYHYRIDEEEKKIYYNYTFEDSPFPQSWKKTDLPAARQPLKYETIFPLKLAKFDSLTVRAPNDVVEFLHARYGPNLDPAMVWDEDLLTYTKVEDHPYWN